MTTRAHRNRYATVDGGAQYSPDLRYRYLLTRRWGQQNSGGVNFICLNPSTATAEEDDPTIRRLMAFADAWGHRNLTVTNLFALRATDPGVMLRHPEPVGPENDTYLATQAALHDVVVAAWGVLGSHQDRAAHVLRLLAFTQVHCLGRTAQGFPKHPLYLRGTTQLEDYQG